MNQVQILQPRLTFIQWFTQAIMRLAHWQIIGSFPDKAKYVVVGAPHTTNWDFFHALMIKGATKVNLHWLGKDNLFRWPLGGLMRWLGGIPVNRRSRNNLVGEIVDLYKRSKQLVIAISPEGTRSHSSYWKSGFYYIALGAGVPIQLVAIDYPSRTLEIGPLLTPCGEIDKDFELIQKFYAGKKGKYPAKQGEIRPRPLDE